MVDSNSQLLKRQSLSGEATQILSLPGREALNRILDSSTPAHLIQSLSPEDLYWLVQDVGPEEALPVLARATSEQWQFILDLELWHKDRLDLASTHEWIALLLKADPLRLIAWGISHHATLLAFYLSNSIDVEIREENEPAFDLDNDYFSLDGTFYVHVRDRRHYEPIRDFLQRLADYDLEKFHQVLTNLSGLIPWESEEEMYRLKGVRLAERGFLPYEEAVGIYQHLDPDRLEAEYPVAPSFYQEAVTAETLPVSPWLSMDDDNRFFRSIMAINETVEVERIQREFAVMCNRIISAEGMQAKSKEDLAALVEKACAYLDVGLERIADADADSIITAVKRFPLEKIFRVGYGMALELKWKIQRWIGSAWFSAQGLNTGFWESEWSGILDGLLLKHPRFYTDFDGPKGEACREFKRIEEVRHCDHILDQVIALDRLLSRLFPKAVRFPITGIHHQPSYKNVLLTAWALDAFEWKGKLRPLTEKELRDTFRDIWSATHPPFRLNAGLPKAFFQWLSRRCGIEASETEGPLGAAIHDLLRELETEYGSVQLDDLDPRYVRHFLASL